MHQNFRTSHARIEPLESRLLLSTYWVSPSGSDANAGSSSAPFATLQKGASVLKAGDTLDVRAGTYAGFIVGYDPAGSSVYGTIAGTASAPITLEAAPGISLERSMQIARRVYSVS